MQAGIKTKIKELTEELAGPRKGGARGGPVFTIRPEGAGQVALLGPPNSGKSSLHHALTGSEAAIGAYPFTTQHPQPGMLPVDDVGISSGRPCRLVRSITSDPGCSTRSAS